MAVTNESLLGSYLKDRRAKLDPAAFGLSGTRRRTPGLRREEVAQRANISATWYTWLEQGRGGAPSADVLDRIARALMLTDAEREHLYMLGLGRLPEVHYRDAGGITPRLQRILDAFEISPALVRTAMWDVVAWNRAAAAILMDYGTLPRERRNVLLMMFGNSRIREAQHDWESVARSVVAAFRADATRAGAASQVGELVDELCRMSPEFEALWNENDVSHSGDGVKRLKHPVLGPITFEYSSFAVDGRPDLSMVVYNPATAEEGERIRAHLALQAGMSL
jgi:transcriptional regulator with XRE-family HTH domain